MPCKTCGSKQPHLHPAIQVEGEVELCTDDFHLRQTPMNVPMYISAVLAKRSGKAPDQTDWRPTTEALCEPGTYINVRTTNTYRFLAYKKDGQRQMGAKGRWQRATEFGWENAPLPQGEFTIAKSEPPQ